MSITRLGYSVEGRNFFGQLACPDVKGKVPGVLIFPEAPGLGPHVIRRAIALAQMNYVALAADVHGDGLLLTDPKTLRPTIDELKREPGQLLRRLQAGLQALKQVSQVDVQRIAAIGYCFGGWCALELARGGALLRGVGIFHGSLSSSSADAAGQIRAKLLVCTGDSDPLVPVQQVSAFSQEMTAAGVDWQLHLYGGVGHGFTSPEAGANPLPGFGYSSVADRRAWTALRAFLDEIFDVEMVDESRR